MSVKKEYGDGTTKNKSESRNQWATDNVFWLRAFITTLSLSAAEPLIPSLLHAVQYGKSIRKFCEKTVV